MINHRHKSASQASHDNLGERTTRGTEGAEPQAQVRRGPMRTGADVQHDAGVGMLERTVLGAVRNVAVEFAVQRSGQPDLSDVDLNVGSVSADGPHASGLVKAEARGAASADEGSAAQLSWIRSMAAVLTVIGLSNGGYGSLVIKSAVVGVTLIGVAGAVLIYSLASVPPTAQQAGSHWQSKVVRHVPPLPLANPSRATLSGIVRATE